MDFCMVGLVKQGIKNASLRFWDFALVLYGGSGQAEDQKRKFTFWGLCLQNASLRFWDFALVLYDGSWGIWCLGHGFWCLGHGFGAWCLDFGAWGMDCSAWGMDFSIWGILRTS
jgi:hypothetical protein